MQEAAHDDLQPSRAGKLRATTSSYRGVCWHRKSRRWQSAINSSGHHVYLGSFDTEEEAARMFDKVALRVRGFRAKINFPYQEYVGPDGQLKPDDPRVDQLASEARKAILEKQRWVESHEQKEDDEDRAGGSDGSKRRRLMPAAGVMDTGTGGAAAVDLTLALGLAPSPSLPGSGLYDCPGSGLSAGLASWREGTGGAGGQLGAQAGAAFTVDAAADLARRLRSHTSWKDGAARAGPGAGGVHLNLNLEPGFRQGAACPAQGWERLVARGLDLSNAGVGGGGGGSAREDGRMYGTAGGPNGINDASDRGVALAVGKFLTHVQNQQGQAERQLSYLQQPPQRHQQQHLGVPSATAPGRGKQQPKSTVAVDAELLMQLLQAAQNQNHQGPDVSDAGGLLTQASGPSLRAACPDMSTGPGDLSALLGGINRGGSANAGRMQVAPTTGPMAGAFNPEGWDGPRGELFSNGSRGPDNLNAAAPANGSDIAAALQSMQQLLRQQQQQEQPLSATNLRPPQRPLQHVPCDVPYRIQLEPPLIGQHAAAAASGPTTRSPRLPPSPPGDNAAARYRISPTAMNAPKASTFRTSQPSLDLSLPPRSASEASRQYLPTPGSGLARAGPECSLGLGSQVGARHEAHQIVVMGSPQGRAPPLGASGNPNGGSRAPGAAALAADPSGSTVARREAGVAAVVDHAGSYQAHPHRSSGLVGGTGGVRATASGDGGSSPAVCDGSGSGSAGVLRPLLSRFLSGVWRHMPPRMTVDMVVPSSDPELLGYTYKPEDAAASQSGGPEAKARASPGAEARDVPGTDSQPGALTGSAAARQQSGHQVTSSRSGSDMSGDGSGDGGAGGGGGSVSCGSGRGGGGGGSPTSSRGGDGAVVTTAPKPEGGPPSTAAAGGMGAGAGVYFRGTYRDLGWYTTATDALQACRSCMAMILDFGPAAAGLDAPGGEAQAVAVAAAAPAPVLRPSAPGAAPGGRFTETGLRSTVEAALVAGGARDVREARSSLAMPGPAAPTRAVGGVGAQRSGSEGYPTLQRQPQVSQQVLQPDVRQAWHQQQVPQGQSLRLSNGQLQEPPPQQQQQPMRQQRQQTEGASPSGSRDSRGSGQRQQDLQQQQHRQQQQSEQYERRSNGSVQGSDADGTAVARGGGTRQGVEEAGDDDQERRSILMAQLLALLQRQRDREQPDHQ